MRLILMVGTLATASFGAFAQADLTQGNDGTSSYGYSFDLPAARGRYQPHLALSYNSGSPGSNYGVGWMLNLSYIEQATRASLDTNGNARNQWWLTLDGAARPLVADPLHSGYYKPDVDSGYTELNYNGNWIMVDGAGTKYTFQLPSANSYRYYLANVIDVDGNTTVFKYTMESSNDSYSSAAILSSVEYNNIPQVPGSYVNSVALQYVANSSPQTEVIDNALVEHNQLLGRVVVQRLGYTLRSYALSYLLSGQTGRQLLSQIQRYGTIAPENGGTPIDQGYLFSYSAENDGGPNTDWFSFSSQAADAGGVPSTALTYSQCELLADSGTCKIPDVAAYLDLDGDGRADMVWSGSAFGGLWWARNQSTPGNISFAAAIQVSGSDPNMDISFANPSGSQSNQNNPSLETLLIDLDGDGLPDEVQSQSPACPGQSQIAFRKNNGVDGGSLTFETSPSCIDLCGTSPGNCPALSNWITATNASPSAKIGLSFGSVVELTDMNGDGIPDYAIAVPGQTWSVFYGYINASGLWQIRSGAATFHLPGFATDGGSSATPLQDVSDGGQINRDLVDMNADGLADIVSSGSSGWSIAYADPSIPTLWRDYEQAPGETYVWQLPAICTTIYCAVEKDADPNGVFWRAGVGMRAGGLTDVNMDGKPDYLYADADGGLYFLPNTGSGFGNPNYTGLNGIPFQSSQEACSLPCLGQPSNVTTVDIDGDGLLDYITIPLNGTPSIHLGTTVDNVAVPDVLTKMRTPSMANVSISYLSSVGFGTAQGFHPHPVVSQVTTTYPVSDGASPATQTRVIKKGYLNPATQQAWDDPHRIDQLGFASTWTEDDAASVVSYDYWGTVHQDQGLDIQHYVYQLNIPGHQYTPPTLYYVALNSTTLDIEQCGVLGSTTYPTLVLTLGVQHTTFEGNFNFFSYSYANSANGGSPLTGIGLSLNSGYIHSDCSTVDSAGNNSTTTVVQDTQTSGTNYTVHSTYADPTSPSVLCKNCLLQTSATSPGYPGVLFGRIYHYDAPVGTFGPAASALTAGHLNYVDELVSGTMSNGVFETSAAISYNVDGTVSTKQQIFAAEPGQPKFVVNTVYLYDSNDVELTGTQVFDQVSGDVLSSTNTYDPNSGLLVSASGPSFNGSASPVTSLQYDSYLRPTGVTMRDTPAGAQHQVSLNGYASPTPTSLGYTWALNFVDDAIAPTASDPGTDDGILSYTYYDGVGKALQTRTRRGTGGAPAATAHIAQGLDNTYLVQSNVYDSAGRRNWSIDPYYATGRSFEDVANTAVGALSPNSNFQAHGTNYTYDPKSRVTCVMYQPIVSGALAAANNSCKTLANASVRASATSYGSAYFDSRWLIQVTSTPDSQTGMPTPGATQSYLDSSGTLQYSVSADGSLTKFNRDALGRSSPTQRFAKLASSASISTSTLYDSKGRVVLTHDDSAGTKIYTYNTTGQLVEEAMTPTADVPEGLNGVQYSYGAFGRMVQKTPFSWTNSVAACGTQAWERTPAPGATTGGTTYYYDDNSMFAGAFGAGGTYTAGRLAAETNSTATVAFSYDSRGHTIGRAESFNALLSKALWSASNASHWNTVATTYRSDGRPTATTVSSPAIATASHSISYNQWYDSLGRPVEVEDSGSQNVFWSALAIGGTGYVAPGYVPAQAAAAYDSLGRLSGQQGSSVGFQFDNQAGKVDYSYNVQSNLLLAYDSRVTAGSATKNMINVSQMAYQGSKLSSYQDTVSGNAYAFSYDTSDRLSGANSAASAVTAEEALLHQSYDETNAFAVTGGGSLWNIQSVTNVTAATTTVYSYGAASLASSADQLTSTSLQSAPATPTSQVTFETFNWSGGPVAGRGLVTSYHATGGPTWAYGYDPEMRVTSVSDGGQNHETIDYDPTGMIGHRHITSDASNTLYTQGTQDQYRVGNDLVISINSLTGVISAVANVFGAHGRLATVDGSVAQALYFHRDRQGTVIGTSTKGGHPGAMYRYEPYGQRTANLYESPANASELGYTGALLLTGGLMHLNSREYLAGMRRFLQADNFDSRRYTYAGGDPVNFTDPSGHMRRADMKGVPSRPFGDDWVGDGTAGFSGYYSAGGWSSAAAPDDADGGSDGGNPQGTGSGSDAFGDMPGPNAVSNFIGDHPYASFGIAAGAAAALGIAVFTAPVWGAVGPAAGAFGAAGAALFAEVDASMAEITESVEESTPLVEDEVYQIGQYLQIPKSVDVGGQLVKVLPNAVAHMQEFADRAQSFTTPVNMQLLGQSFTEALESVGPVGIDNLGYRVQYGGWEFIFQMSTQYGIPVLNHADFWVPATRY